MIGRRAQPRMTIEVERVVDGRLERRELRFMPRDLEAVPLAPVWPPCKCPRHRAEVTRVRE